VEWLPPKKSPDRGNSSPIPRVFFIYIELVTNDSRQEGPQRSQCRTETLETRLGGHGQDGEDEALLSFMDRFTDIDLICGLL
jgi:hypothetical protein